MKGILGKKVGMTEVFTKSGKLIPVTVIQVEPNVVTQVKTVESDGYNAIQVGVFDKKEKNATKAELGHTKKANTAPKRFLKEIKNVEATYNLGDKISADIFAAGEVVDVTGTSKGKGFQGPIKRHGQSRGPETHGSRYHRRVGSMGTLRPMRVMKGKKLPGHMGHETITIQNLEIIDINLAENYILVSGNVPGAKNSYVFIKSAVKNPKARKAEELVSSMETVIDEVVETTEEVSALEVTETEAVEVAEEALEETVETPAEEESVEEVSEEAVEETVVESEGSIEETKEPETEVTE